MPSRAGDDTGIVGADQEGDPRGGIELGHQGDEILGGLRIEIGGRLVGKHDRPTPPARGRQRRAAAGRLIGRPAGGLPCPQSDIFQRGDRAFAAFARRDTRSCRISSMFSPAERTGMDVGLEDESDLVQPELVSAPCRGDRDRRRRPYRAPARPVEAADHVEQRRLARARGAGQRGEVAGGDVEIDAIQGRDLDGAKLVGVSRPRQEMTQSWKVGDLAVS